MTQPKTSREGLAGGVFCCQWFFWNCPVFRNASCLPSPRAKHVCQAPQQKNKWRSFSLYAPLHWTAKCASCVRFTMNFIAWTSAHFNGLRMDMINRDKWENLGCSLCLITTLSFFCLFLKEKQTDFSHFYTSNQTVGYSVEFVQIIIASLLFRLVPKPTFIPPSRAIWKK